MIDFSSNQIPLVPDMEDESDETTIAINRLRRKVIQRYQHEQQEKLKAEKWRLLSEKFAAE